MKNEKDISKPITLIREDFIRSLVDLINDSQLPYFVVETVLKDTLQEVRIASQKQLESDRNKYNSELRELSITEG